MSAWVACGQPRRRQTPFFHSIAARDVGPALEAEPLGLHRLPDVDVRVADDQHVLADGRAARRSSAIRLSLEPATRWSTSTPTRRSGPGCEVAQVVGQVVDAVEVLDDDALDPQVVAPDLLDQLGVVAALDEDPAGAGHPRLGAVARRPSPDAVRVGLAGRRPRRAAARITGRPSSRKPGPSGNVRRLPRRSSRVSVSRSRSTATISPHKSVVTSSTTAPSSAAAGTARPRLGARQSAARTSEP